jgi:hypothetical protein
MDSTEKTVLIVGGLGLGAILLFSLFKQSQLNALAAANQPGLQYQPSMPYPDDTGTLGSILSGISIGSSALGSIFAGFSNSGTSNDPGLDSGEDDIAYTAPASNYSYDDSNSYAPGVTQNSTLSSDDSTLASSYFDTGAGLF